MKQSNIVDGLRVRVKKSTSLKDLVGKTGTAVGVPYVGFGGTYVKVNIDGEDFVSHFNSKSLAYSNEVPKIGDRIIILDSSDHMYFNDGAAGVIQRPSMAGWLVKFDNGGFLPCSDNTWSVSSKTKIAIIRNGS